jgi:hypothetical protein
MGRVFKQLRAGNISKKTCGWPFDLFEFRRPARTLILVIACRKRV